MNTLLKRRYFIIFSFIVLIGILTISSTNILSIAPPSGHTFKCSGYVYQYGTSTKLSGVTVQMINPDGFVKASYTTGTSGYYALSISTSDYAYYTIRASKSGYETSQVTKYSSGIYTVNFYLKKPYSYIVHGYVRDDATFNNLDATVRLYKSGTLLQTVSTNNGYYSFSAVTVYSDTSFVVKASSVGYSDKSYTVNSGTTGGTTYQVCYLNEIKKYAVMAGIGDYWSILTEDDPYRTGDLVQSYTTLQLYGFDFIWMYGDDHAATDYPQITWAGLATKSNVRLAVQYMAQLADSNDIIAFFFRGHGTNLLPIDLHEHFMVMLDFNDLFDGLYSDDELKNDISNTAAAKIYINNMCCTSGGIIDDFESLPDKERYLIITSCQYYEYSNFVFNYDLNNKIVEFYNAGIYLSLEDAYFQAFTNAYNVYPFYLGPIWGYMTPQLFDGDPNNEFYIHDY